jgi:hypothetical protein
MKNSTLNMNHSWLYLNNETEPKPTEIKFSENPFKKQESTIPINIQIANFIRDEFSKIKKEQTL